MAAARPLEVTVGQGTPVHIHVTRQPQTAAQSLEAALAQQQRTRAAAAAGATLAAVPGTAAGAARVRSAKEAFHPAPCRSQPARALRPGVPVGAPRRVAYSESDGAAGPFDKELAHQRAQSDLMAQDLADMRAQLVRGADLFFLDAAGS